MSRLRVLCLPVRFDVFGGLAICRQRSTTEKPIWDAPETDSGIPGSNVEGDALPVLRKIVVAAAVLAGTVICAYPSSAQPLTSSSSGSSTGHARLATGSWHAYSEPDWSGPEKTFSGNTGDCNYVGDNWNDRIRSARADGANTKVELWDNADCTGGSIVIDGSGYHSIGDWVSAYRVTS